MFAPGPTLQKAVILGREVKGLYCLEKGEALQEANAALKRQILKNNNQTEDNVIACFSASELWHFRLGHLPFDQMRHVGISQCNNLKFHGVCQICPMAKMHRSSFSLSNTRASANFELLHVDIWGPYPHSTYNGSRFFLTIVDDHSRATWVHLLAHKSNAFPLLKAFVVFVERQFEATVKIIRSDNGLEFKDNSALAFYRDKGIIHQTSCVDTPQQNGVVERKHQHLLQIARASMFQSNLPRRYWGEALLTAVYLINRMPTAVLDYKTPFEVLHKVKPSHDHLRTFGCLSYASTLKRHREKLQPKAHPCIFLGYPYGQKAYKLLDLTTNKIFTSRDVVFHEHIFPFHQFKDHSASPLPNITDFIPAIEDFQVPAHDHFMDQSTSGSSSLTNTTSSASTYEHTSTPDASPSLQNQQPVPLRRSTRAHHQPRHLQDYFCGIVQSTKLPATHALVTTLTQLQEPKSYEQACKDPGWVAAMNTEIEALMTNNTWELVPLPQGKKAISNKWVYKVKLKSDRSLERLKAILVIRGFTQQYGIDYQEVFSPVVKMATIRSVIALAASKGWPLSQLDVNNAFLHGDLNEEVYMEVPKGIPNPSNKVCRLKKSLYGLKQASRQWFSKLSSTLLSLGYQQSKMIIPYSSTNLLQTSPLQQYM